MTALGVALLVIGATIVVAEAHVPTLGILGGPGVAAMALGSVLAVGGLGGGILLALLAAVAVTAVGATGVALSVRKGTAVRQRRVRTGAEGLVGRVGVVRSWGARANESPAAQADAAARHPRGDVEGSVLVDGALWRARLAWSDESGAELHAGDSIVVERLTGLTLAVRPAEDWELAP